jgi:hypothetical protein
VRGAADDAFPVQVCAAPLLEGARAVGVSGIPVPLPARVIRRIVVIGDTGCRLKGQFVQDCNDPAAWPFARVAWLAALRRPDLVIHVGDYYYRETACPQGRPGCAGSPYGDNWATWKADFFDPAGPLLASAPWIMLRGNHEDCARGGPGWFRLLDPHPAPAACEDRTEPYVVRAPGLDLLVFDSADADDARAPPDKVAAYRAQFNALFGRPMRGAWLLTHRPVWAEAEGAGIPAGAISNATLEAAIAGLIPAGLDLVLSGHVHDFMAYNFGPSRPAQLVVGESGDELDDIAQPIHPGVVLDSMAARRAMGFAEYGYMVLERVGRGWAGTVYSLADHVLARCTLMRRELVCRGA